MAESQPSWWPEALERIMSQEFRRGFSRFLFMLDALSRPALWVLREERENPLWFLVDPLLDFFDEDDGHRLVYLAAEREDELVDVISELLIEGGGAELLAGALSGVDDEVPGRTSRRHTVHGLEHLARGEWLHAWPPMVIGLEGQVRAHATASGKIDADGRLTGGRQRPGVEGVAKQLALAEHFERFLLRRVYGGTGHLFRHGVAESGVRRQVVYMAVATAGWLEVLRIKEPWDWFVSRLKESERLQRTLESHGAEADSFVLDLMAKSFEGKSAEELERLQDLFRDWGEPPI